MTIAKKLYYGFGSILVLLVVLLLVNLSVIARERAARQNAAAAVEGVRSIETVRFKIMQNRLSLRGYLLSGDPREEDQLNRGISDLLETIHKSLGKATFHTLQSALQDVDASERDWAEHFSKPLVAKRHRVDSGDATVADLQVDYLQLDPNSHVTRSGAILDQAAAAMNTVMTEADESSTSSARVASVVSTLGTVLVILLGLAVAYFASKSITEPLAQLMKTAQEIGETGDLEQFLDTSRKDEVGALAKSFGHMMSYLKEMAAAAECIARGQLAIETRPRSDRDTMGKAFASMSGGLRDLVRQVRDSATQVAAGSNQVAEASVESAKLSVQASSAIDEVSSTMHEMSVNVQNVVRNTQNQASSVAETSASIDQMVTSIQRVADTAKMLLDISNRSRDEVRTGIATMEQTTDGMARTSHAIQQSSDTIQALGKRADDIGKIIEVIDDLAEQTNLLALNAAIEAARAGEHGLGFAVVADEVRKLAEKSTQSTKEISELIQSIQKEAREAVHNMEKSTEIVEEGLVLGKELNEALLKISTVVTEVFKFAQEIGAATTQQSVGSSQIAKTTNRLNEITQEISSSVEEQASGAQAVVRAMEKMRELVQHSTSGSTELAAASEQMSKLARAMLKTLENISLEQQAQALGEGHATERFGGPTAGGNGHSRPSGAGYEPRLAELVHS
ncbi:MAG TPA: methyl-accepting chemotaxis protein [Candidatus Binatia bacterium]|nr:methyl-accepting chemotaxis protein [Candidatus Solibacter sp.]HUK53644.1 methyl-accepting chemotaxis protein [Candidatus Binatia bacterium]